MKKVVYNSEGAFALKDYLEFIGNTPSDENLSLEEQVQKFEAYLNHVISSFELGSKNINVAVNHSDREFIDLVIDYIKNELYPRFEGKYLKVYNNGSISQNMCYYEAKEADEDSFPHTKILDMEYIHLSTCTKIADRSDKPFEHYVNLFDYQRFSQLYDYVFVNVKEFICSASNISDVISEEDLLSSLQKLSLDDLLMLESFADAKAETPSLSKNRDLLEFHNKANGIIHHARAIKEKASKKNIIGRIRTSLRQNQ